MSKPEEIIPPDLIREVQKIEPKEDVGYTDQNNEQFMRAIYKNQSTHQLELVIRLLLVIVSANSKKEGPIFFVGLHPSGRYNTIREETRIKERFLIELEKEGYIKNLYTRIAEVPDIEGPFTSDIIIASFQYLRSDLIKALEIKKIDLEQKIRIRIGDKIKFENESLKFDTISKPFKGGQGKMIELLFQNRKEYIGTQVIIDGQSIIVKKLKDAGGYLKGDFRSALKQCRTKLTYFNKARVNIEIKNTNRGKGLYQLIVHYLR